METILGLVVLLGIGKLLFGKNNKPVTREEREKQTIFKYPKGGYGLNDDPVWDELFFLDILDGED